MAEIWKPIKAAESYTVSNRGQIKKNDSLVPQELDKQGYLIAKINSIVYRVHNIVAYHFLSTPAPGAKPQHKDGIKTNNHCSNLQWDHQPKKRNKLKHIDIERIRELWQGGLTQKEIAGMYGITQQNVNLIVNGYTWKEKVKEEEGNEDA